MEMFAVRERSWHSYAIFGLMLAGEWNGFLSAIMIGGIFAFLVAALAYYIDSKGDEEEKK
ncbi:MAG TPA: hypothetical protein EYN88_01715 [Candidatus Poseidoniales archaeon]|nr:hypothetical protein [Candidatus Poseidoniales archaeon]